MTEITRKPAFWIAFAVVSVLSAVFAWRFFPQALPLIKLDVKMTRDDALDRASALAGKLGLAPLEARRAALFTHDGTTQNFVELDAGGKPKFAELLTGELYAPYWWEVRLFHPNETAEARLRFRPDGSPYGFQLKVPEADRGAALDASAARAIAEARAVGDWAIDFAPYKLLEQSEVRRSSGRVDHTFVYQREHETLGDGRFRLRLGVAGDRLSELSHYVYVPEAFKLRFQEMRSDNETIAKVASLAAATLYGIGGCILGTLWLLRRRALLWKRALVAGAVVAGINALALLANAPQAWFSYDTAQPVWVFWGTQVGFALLVFLFFSLGLALVFMAAEGLSRRAFPDHPQLWRIWSREAAPTLAVLGRTLGGYLFVPIELALIAAFYFVTNRYLGWWQPSEALTDPNILGSALPALAPIGMALQAGFMEECLFRAIPLSIAALLGARFGHRRIFIGAALVLEAVIFGAAHANYPGFPAYSRLVELVIPAFIWGLIFLRFGLLTTVILHAVFDLVLMSIPVFLVEGSGSGFNQALVLAAGLVPLAIVALHRVRAGRWLELPAIFRNRAWQSGAAVAEAAARRVRAGAGRWTTLVQRALPTLGVAGLLAIAFGADFHSDAPPLEIGRAKAEAAADDALKNRGITLGPEWQQAAATKLASEDGTWLWHKFVWREGGHDTYAHLIGSWLAPPMWEVRYARFEGGDVVDRSEEWRVTVAGDGSVRQVRHQLPERRPGAKLSRDQARIIAPAEVNQRFGLDPEALREVSVKDDPQPARNDWKFTFSDPRVDAGVGGEARVGVDIAGTEVVNSGRYVFVPEAWQRAETDRAGRLGVVKNIVTMAVVIVVIAALIASIVAWSRSRFDRRAFWIAATLVLSAAGGKAGDDAGEPVSCGHPADHGSLGAARRPPCRSRVIRRARACRARTDAKDALDTRCRRCIVCTRYRSTAGPLFARHGAELAVVQSRGAVGAMARTHLRNAELGLDGDDHHGDRALLAGSPDRGVDAPARARCRRSGACAGCHGCRQRRSMDRNRRRGRGRRSVGNADIRDRPSLRSAYRAGLDCGLSRRWLHRRRAAETHPGGGGAGAHRERNCAYACVGRDALSAAAWRESRSVGNGGLNPAQRKIASTAPSPSTA